LEAFLYLAEIGAGFNISDVDGDTALHYAASSVSVLIIKISLDNGMAVVFTNAKNAMPLHLSALNYSMEATKYLVYCGAAINNTNILGATPLMLADSNGNLDVCYLT
jgi:ankyrin